MSKKKNKPTLQDKKVVQKTNEKESWIDKVYRFPNVINRITLLLIVMLVLVITSGTLVLIARANKDTVYMVPDEETYFFATNSDKVTNKTIIDEENHFLYDYMVNSYLEVATQNTMKANSETNEDEYTFQYRIRLYSKTNYDSNYLYYTQRVSFADDKGVMTYLNELEGNENVAQLRSTAGKTLLSNVEYKNYIDKIFVKIGYGSEKQTIDNSYSFVEEILKIKKSDIKDFTDKANVEDVFGVGLTVSAYTDATDPYYDVKMNINLFYNVRETTEDTFVNKPYHVDAQSWVVTENGDIYPLIGVYNYGFTRPASNGNANYSTATAVRLYDSVKPEYFLIKGIHKDSNQKVSEVYYRVSLADLLK